MFFVEFNDSISLQAIQANSYTELLYPNTYSIPNGADFYVGLYTGDSFPVNGVYADPLFGWGELFNNNGTFQLVDSALAYGSQGIYAGTLNLVPEPSTLSLFGLGALPLGWRWSRKVSTETSA